MGQSPDSSSYNADCEGLPFYQGNADFGETHPTPRIWCSEPKKVAEAGDILISVRAPVGAINVADERCCIGRELAVVRPSGSDISNAFLALILQSKRAYLDSMSTGSTFKAIGKKVLSSCEAPLYSHEVQSRIACQINGIDDCLRSSRKLLSTLDDLVKSRFVEMFGDPKSNPHGWDIGTIETIAANLDAKSVPITQSDREEGPYPYYGATGAVDSVSGYIFDERLLLVSEDGANLLARTYPIAFSIFGKTWVNNHAHVLKVQNEETQVFLEKLINMMDISEFITGSTQPKLTQKQLNQIPVMLPPMSLQRQFAEFVARVDKLGFDVQQQIEKLETLKQSLMQEYFG